MSRFEESKFYKSLQDFFINNNKDTFLQFIAEFYNRTESIIDKNKIQDDLIKELRELYLEFNEKGIDNNIVREKVNYFLENSLKIKDINTKLTTNTNNIKNINSQMDTKAKQSDLEVERARIDSFTTQLDTKIRYINTVTELKTENLKLNETVKTLGYYNIGDGGASYYIITDENIEVNDIDIILCNNGLIAKLISDKNYVEGKQFGVKSGSLSTKPERINNKKRLQRCIDFAIENSIKKVKFEDEYRLETENVNEYALTIEFDTLNPKNCLDLEMTCYLQCYNCNGILIKNVTNSNININLAYGGYATNPEQVTGVTILNCRQLNFKINGNNYNGTLAKIGSSIYPVTMCTGSINCYGGYRCLIHGSESDEGRQQFFGTYETIFYNNTTKGCKIVNSDDIHIKHFENLFSQASENALEIINSTVRFSYLGLGNNCNNNVLIKGDGSISTCTIDKLFMASTGNSKGVAITGNAQVNISFFEDSGCRILIDLYTLSNGSYVNIDNIFTKKNQGERVTIRKDGVNLNEVMNGGKYKLIVN